ncbi:MAG: hypothetical protein GTN62_06560 [Gemmatimonadales bacterium]|nr:hypothetical protein [Gemmatimonadales bacterium]NIN11159.1 hypothetical protein [Gemmatimonadales bacterium]NIN49758.1 hypothetical protein [Gemmatimonadales bacterium]NIP07222.1 hypothetical protein [Gemmatimonadales bacterium]NIR00435.1 hypothetical protein [Gemmatimonadales bacterium]
MPSQAALLTAGFAAWIMAIPPALNAQQDSAKVPHRVPKVFSQVRVDGVLDEDLWQQALVMELDYEVRPGENIPPPVRTEVLLAYTDSHLLAAFRAYDPDPSAIRATITDRDAMYGDDWVALVLDTFNDERRTFDFFCNPLGVQGDEIESPQGGGAWDAIWDSDGRITPEGYEVEMAIPFSSMRFQRSEGDQIWGFDAVRSYPRAVRHHIGLFPRDRNNNCYMCQSEKLIGFAGATPGRNVELDPTVYGVVTQERDGFPSGQFAVRDKDFEPGITARWGLTPSLTLNATANPDFSNIEADVAQLDINTQFALYYPERRPFFLEGASFFNTRFRAVHTRQLADPIWGTKLTGKEGGNAIGFFTVHDEITNLLFPGSQGSSVTSLAQKNVGSVLRYRRDIGRASNIGVLVTDREANDYANRVAGVDGIWKFSAKDQVRFQALGSWTRYPDSVSSDFGQPGGGFLGGAYRFDYLHNTRSHDWYLEYRQVDRDFRADLGFMPQADYRVAEVGWGHTWNNDPDNWWNMLNFGSSVRQMWDLDGTTLQRAYSFWFNYAGLTQTFFNLGGTYGEQTHNGVVFTNRNVGFDFGIRPSGSLFFVLDGFLGERIDYANTRAGRGLRLEPYAELKLGRHLVLNLSHAFERLSVDEGRLYTANISQLRAVYCFSKRIFMRTILQYVHYDRNADVYTFEIDPVSKSLFSQLLFSYKINPQTVLFVGYSDNHTGDHEIGLTQRDRTVFVKIGYAWVL